MTVLDSFYLLFKTDAKGAQADVAALDKQIADLAAKGQKRDEAEVKQLKELRKQRAEMTRDIKDQTKEVDKLGQSFVKTIENVASAGTALFAFTAIKAGVQHATDFNSQLLVTSKILGQNVKSLSAFASAAEAAGGTKEGAIGQYQSLALQYSSQGLKPPTPEELITNLRKSLANYKTPEAKLFQLQRLGISDPGIISEALASPEELAAYQKQGKSSALTEEQTQKLRDLKRSEVEAGQEVTHWFGKLGTELSTVIIPGLQALGKVLHTITNVPGGSTTLGLGGLLASWFGGKWAVGKLGSKLGNLLGIGSKAAPAAGEAVAAVAGASAATIGAIIVGAAAAAGSLIWHKQIADWVDTNVHGDDDAALRRRFQSSSNRTSTGIGPLGIRSNNPGNLQPGGHEAVYATPEAGLGALASQLRRYGSRGWDTVESILGHYAPPGTNNTEAYINAVARDTGFARGQRLNLNDPSVLQKLIPAIIKHENGYNPYNDSMIQSSIAAGKGALASVGSLGFQSSTPGGDKSVNIKTGDINVHTQATDAHGIASDIGSELKTQFRLGIASWDDGVAA